MKHLPFIKSQILTEWSSLEESKYFPLGWKKTYVIQFSCPSNVFTHFPVAIYHSLIRQSLAPLAKNSGRCLVFTVTVAFPLIPVICCYFIYSFAFLSYSSFCLIYASFLSFLSSIDNILFYEGFFWRVLDTPLLAEVDACDEF